MFVSCDSQNYLAAHKDVSTDITCQVASGATHSLTYSASTGLDTRFSGTADYDCDAVAAETMVLPFTGSGTSITYSPTCRSATSDATDGDTNRGLGSGQLERR